MKVVVAAQVVAVRKARAGEIASENFQRLDHLPCRVEHKERSDAVRRSTVSADDLRTDN